MLNLLPAVLVSVAAITFYLGAPGQTWLREPLPRRVARRLALAFSVAAVVLGARALHPATSLSLVAAIAMAWLTACPFIGAWLNRRRKLGSAESSR